jgi:hypothetical protein
MEGNFQDLFALTGGRELKLNGRADAISSLNTLINPFPRHRRAEQLCFSRRLERFFCRQQVWLGNVLAMDFDAGCEPFLGR